ncbi:hypothetical protein ACH5RR_031786 [Cinchona calisaya]|uniref:RING-type domain-containing protein n=1 Tax=Cinchona calisaya TaxID=153742 RepID=A0ABD2YIZ9_9GENT
MEEQQEFKIATILAEILDGNNDCSTILDAEFEEEEEYHQTSSAYAKINGMMANLAMSRAQETGRDFKTVLEETQLKIHLKLGEIMAKTIHPGLQVLTKIIVDEEEEEEEPICGICQDEMKAEDDVRAMACKHAFHGQCIFKWLDKKLMSSSFRNFIAV